MFNTFCGFHIAKIIVQLIKPSRLPQYAWIHSPPDRITVATTAGKTIIFFIFFKVLSRSTILPHAEVQRDLDIVRHHC